MRKVLTFIKLEISPFRFDLNMQHDFLMVNQTNPLQFYSVQDVLNVPLRWWFPPPRRCFLLCPAVGWFFQQDNKKTTERISTWLGWRMSLSPEQTVTFWYGSRLRERSTCLFSLTFFNIATFSTFSLICQVIAHGSWRRWLVFMMWI